MRLVYAFELTKRDGKFQSREAIEPDFELVIDPVDYYFEDTAYNVDVHAATEGFPLAAVDVQYLARLLRGERGAANAKYRKRIDKILGVLGESLPPEVEVEVTDL